MPARLLRGLLLVALAAAWWWGPGRGQIEPVIMATAAAVVALMLLARA
jgi:hypothetical protein